MYTRVCTLLVCLFSAVKESEPLSRHAYVISVEALPCSAPNSSAPKCVCVCVCVCVGVCSVLPPPLLYKLRKSPKLIRSLRLL